MRRNKCKVSAITYKFQANPKNSCKPYLNLAFSARRNFYNMCLQHRLDAYKKAGIIFKTYGMAFDHRLPKGSQLVGEPQGNCVKYIKDIFPEYSDVNFRVFHCVVKELDTAWDRAAPTLYHLEHLHDITATEARVAKDKKKKKGKTQPKITPKISTIETKYVEITPTLSIPEDSFKFNENLKGAFIRRDLPEGHPYVNTNRIENLKFVPGFISKNDRQSFMLTDSGWSFNESTGILTLTMGKAIKATIKVRNYRKMQGQIKTVSVIHDNTHKWWVTFSCINVPLIENETFTGKSIGIDFGFENVLTMSDGTIIPNPQFLKKSTLIRAQAQRRLDAHKHDKTSRKYKQAKKWLARCEEKTKNQRLYFARDLAKKIVDEFDIIYLEDIKLTTLVKHRVLEELEVGWTRDGDKKKNKKALDAGIAIVRNCIIGRARRVGKTVIMVPSYYTTQTCSECGDVRKEKDRLTLKDKVYVCRKCGLELHRDINAALVILQRGERMQVDELEKESERLKSLLSINERLIEEVA